MQMARRFFGTGLALAAALCVTAALAGPALAGGSGPSARTGNIQDDCNGFSLSGTTFYANCRTSDDNTDRSQTSVNLVDEVGNNNGDLACDSSQFQSTCDTISLSNVELSANCLTGEWAWGPAPDYYRYAVRNDSSLSLNDCYRVNSSGDLEVR